MYLKLLHMSRLKSEILNLLHGHTYILSTCPTIEGNCIVLLEGNSMLYVLVPLTQKQQYRGVVIFHLVFSFDQLFKIRSQLCQHLKLYMEDFMHIIIVGIVFLIVT